MILPKPSSTLRNYKVICNVVIGGTYLVIAAIVVLLWADFMLYQDTRTMTPLGFSVLAAVYTTTLHVLTRRNYHDAVAYLLTLFYLALGTGIIWTWGIHTPMAPLIFGLAIVLAGILLTARSALYAAIVSGLAFVVTQIAYDWRWHIPDMSWVGSDSSLGDVLGYSVVFAMLALVCWLYNREMQRSLFRARQAQAALLGQKASLEQQVTERTAQLRQSQLEETRQLYRFAELGQMGVTLLHDLANHITALTLEIEGLQDEKQSKELERARQITKYLEEIVDNTRDRLHGGAAKQQFDLVSKLSQTIAFLRYKAAEKGIKIVWNAPKGSWQLKSDPASLCQVVAIITNNAIDAFEHVSSNSQVAIVLSQDEKSYVIKISDNGKGISKADRKQLFKPFRSTKKSGLGLGLFIAKQTVETTLDGTIELNPWSDQTEFIITLPT